MKIYNLVLLSSFLNIDATQKHSKKRGTPDADLSEQLMNEQESHMENTDMSIDQLSNRLKFCASCIKKSCDQCQRSQRISCTSCSAKCCHLCRKKYDDLKNPNKDLIPKLKEIQDQIEKMNAVSLNVQDLPEMVGFKGKFDRITSRAKECKDILDIYAINNKIKELKTDQRYKSRMISLHAVYILISLGCIIVSILNMMYTENFNIAYVVSTVFTMIILNHFFYHLKCRLELRLEKHWDRNFILNQELPKGIKPSYKTTRWNFEFYTLIIVPILNIILNIVSFVSAFSDAVGLTNCGTINGTKECDFSILSLVLIFLDCGLAALPFLKRLSYQKTEMDDLK